MEEWKEGRKRERERETGAEMELLKLYDCCVPNFRLGPSVVKRGGGCYTPPGGAKEIDGEWARLEKEIAIFCGSAFGNFLFWRESIGGKTLIYRDVKKGW